jgi:hypothetical protein
MRACMQVLNETPGADLVLADVYSFGTSVRFTLSRTHNTKCFVFSANRYHLVGAADEATALCRPQVRPLARPLA